VLLIVVTVAACAQTPATVRSARAGFAEGSGLLYRSNRALAHELDGIAATGARWLRVDVDWDLVEHDRHELVWQPIDRVVAAARRRGLDVLGLLTYTPPWARPPGTSNKHPPTDVDDFARFAREAAARYGSKGVAAWEIWNEPNSAGFWEPAADPRAYAALLTAAARAIRTVDPSSTIVSGGLAPSADGDGSVSPSRFLTGIYDAGARASFDAVGHHPYHYPASPLTPTADPNDNAFGGVVPQLRQIMVARGDAGKRIWGTESGAPTTGSRAPQSLAAHVRASFTAWNSWDYTGPLFWYSYRDAGAGPDPEDHFGIVRATLEPKGDALQVLRREISRR